MFDALTLDQLKVFLAVTENRSFSEAARQLGRSASAITYVIKKMEEQLGVELFDRTSYRANLTEAGRILLPRARRVSEEMHALRITAKGIATGLEADLTVAIDSMFPLDDLTSTLSDFQTTFPTVQLKLFVETFGAARRMVEEDHASFALTSDFTLEDPGLVVLNVREIVPIMVASRQHALGNSSGMINADYMASHVQLVMMDRLTDQSSRDWSVYSGSTLRVGDIQTKLQFLRAGLGFGTMPYHLVEQDLKTGVLVQLDIDPTTAPRPFPIALIRRRETVLGPAARWFISEIEKC